MSLPSLRLTQHLKAHINFNILGKNAEYKCAAYALEAKLTLQSRSNRITALVSGSINRPDSILAICDEVAETYSIDLVRSPQ